MQLAINPASHSEEKINDLMEEQWLAALNLPPITYAQAHKPAGSSEGGQFTSGGGGPKTPSDRYTEIARDETRTPRERLTAYREAKREELERETASVSASLEGVVEDPRRLAGLARRIARKTVDRDDDVREAIRSGGAVEPESYAVRLLGLHDAMADTGLLEDRDGSIRHDLAERVERAVLGRSVSREERESLYGDDAARAVARLSSGVQDRYGRAVSYVKDAQGHEHRGAGPGGGQFTSGGSESKTSEKPKSQTIMGAPIYQEGVRGTPNRKEIALVKGDFGGRNAWRWESYRVNNWTPPAAVGDWVESEEEARRDGWRHAETDLGVKPPSRSVYEFSASDFATPETFGKSLVKALSSAPNLPQEERDERSEDVGLVVAKLPSAVVTRLNGRLRSVHSYEDLDSIARGWDEKSGEPGSGKGVQGFYSAASGRLAADGGQMGLNVDRFDNNQRWLGSIVAHELGHAIDATGRGGYEYSTTREFGECFRSEIAGGQLSEYARTDPQEGFAEFCRLLYGSDTDRDTIEREFPETVDFFGERGLLPWEY